MASVPKQLTERHLVAARLLAAGARRGEVAQALGWNPSTVSPVARSPAFQAAVAGFQRRLHGTFVAALTEQIVGPPRPWPHCGRSANSA